MPDKRKLRYQIITVIGGSFLFLPDGGLWTWGNLSVYVLSYMHMTKVEETTLQTPWLISFFLIAFTIGAMVAGTASKNIGCKPTIAISVLLFDGGLFLSYFSVQHSMNTLNFTNGFMPGFGFGIIMCLVTQNAIEWADGNKGLFTALVQASGTLGGALNIQLASLYINPNNETPNLELGPIKLFTQTDVIRNVPSVYLILGTVNLGIHLIGFILLKDKLSYAKDLPEAEKNLLQGKNSFVKYSDNLGNDDQTRREDSKASHSDVQEKGRKDTLGISKVAETDRSAVVLFLSDSNSLERRFGKDESESKSEDLRHDRNTCIQIDFTPREMLRCKTFYLLWFVLFCNDWGYITYTNYYKTFGQSYISDDHLLANVGTAMTTIVIVSRIVWGLLIDRLGVKWIMVLLTAVFSLLFATYYFTPIFSEGIYVIWSVLIACVDYNVYSNFSIVTLKIFGEKNFASNFGLVISIGVILNLGGPPLLRLILKNFGWFAIFLTPGILNFFSLVMVIAVLPNV